MTNIKEMTKEEYIAYRVAEGMDAEKANKLFATFENDAKEFGITDPAEALDYVKRRFSAASAKKKRGVRETFYAVFLSSNMTDYGAQKEYDKAMELYKADPEKAISSGFTNEEGEPIWNTPSLKWKHGSKIIPEDEMQNELLGIAITETAFDANKTKAPEQKERFKDTILNLKGKLSKIDVPMGAFIKFSAGKKQSSNEVENHLFGTDDFDFDLIQVLSIKEVRELINDYFKASKVTISQLPEFAEAHRSDYTKNGLAIVEAAVTDVLITDATKASNLLTINDAYDESLMPVTCWVQKHIPLDFSVETPEVIVVGKVSISNDNNVSINTRGVFVDSKYKVKPDNEEVAKSVQ